MTDAFTTAARAEADVLVDDIICWDDTIATDGPCDGTWDSLAGHLVKLGWTKQEPTDAEVEAAARALAHWDGADGWGTPGWTGEIPETSYVHGARAALLAARSVRR